MTPSDRRFIFKLTCKPAPKTFQHMSLRIAVDKEFPECVTFGGERNNLVNIHKPKNMGKVTVKLR